MAASFSTPTRQTRVSTHVDRAKLPRHVRDLLAVVGNPGTVYSGLGTSLTIDGTFHVVNVLLDKAAGTAVALPAATGTGLRVRFVCGIAKSGGSDVISAAGTDVFKGVAVGVETDSANAVKGFAAASNSNTVTFDGATKGGVNVGDYFEIADLATGKWFVTASMLTATGGAFATPFSHV
jgi:hypothetical protein